tara:strand:+ start:60 stop:890 length:831 start_codon:yes stop_codon:yes gene_type:complete
MLTVDPKIETTKTIHRYLLGAVAPRPIAFASTINENGDLNLSPFSFFNAFSANPPILIFSPARRVRDNTIKHTLENVLKNKEVVISIASAEMAQQVSLSSVDFEKGISEFSKAGFTPKKSTTIKPYCVEESPVNFECKVNQVIELGTQGGSGNLVVCEILKMHIKEEVLDEKKNIDPIKLNHLSRLGGNWYGKSTESSLFKIQKPIGKMAIGIDSLPEEIRLSTVLSGSDLAILASVEKIPEKQELTKSISTKEKHILAKNLLEEGDVLEAWKILL